MNGKIRVLLADDHPLVRTGLRTTLSAEADLELVGEATDGNETQRLCQELQPDVLLLDLNMPGPTPVETVNSVRQHNPHLKVLVLTAYDDEIYIRSIVAAGAVGYVLKDEAPEVLVHAIRTVFRGGSWFSSHLMERLVQKKGEPRPVEAEDLSQRERQILTCIGQGWDNARIASELNLAEQTVRNYVSRIYFKLGVSNRAEAIVWAREHLQPESKGDRRSSARS